MKSRSPITLVVFGLVAVALLVAVGAAWVASSRAKRDPAVEQSVPPYIMSELNPAFGRECGENGLDVGGGGFSINPDIRFHAANSIAIVEGTARQSGPARFGDLGDDPNAEEADRKIAATGINTLFVITVKKTYKGEERSEWTVSEPGGLVGCVSYRQSADSARLLDGARGLFFISGSHREWPGPWVSMTIATNGPEWFVFTEKNFGSIDGAIEVVETLN